MARSKLWRIFAKLSDISMMLKSCLAGIAVISILRHEGNNRCSHTTVDSCTTNASLGGQDHQFPYCYKSASGEYYDDDNADSGFSSVYQFNSSTGLQCTALSASAASDFCQPIDTTETPRKIFICLLSVNQVLFAIAIGWRIWFKTKLMHKGASACLIAVSILITIGKIVAVFHLVIGTSTYQCNGIDVSSPQGDEFNSYGNVPQMTFTSCTSSRGVFDLHDIHSDCIVSPQFGRCSKFNACPTPTPNDTSSEYINAPVCKNAFAPDCKLTYSCDCDFTLPGSVFALVAGFAMSALYLSVLFHRLGFGEQAPLKRLHSTLLHGAASVKLAISMAALLELFHGTGFTGCSNLEYSNGQGSVPGGILQTACSPQVKLVTEFYSIAVSCVLVLFVLIFVGATEACIGKIRTKVTFLSLLGAVLLAFVLVLSSTTQVRLTRPYYQCSGEVNGSSGKNNSGYETLAVSGVCRTRQAFLPSTFANDVQQLDFACQEYCHAAIPPSVYVLEVNLFMGLLYATGLIVLLWLENKLSEGKSEVAHETAEHAKDGYTLMTGL